MIKNIFILFLLLFFSQSLISQNCDSQKEYIRRLKSDSEFKGKIDRLNKITNQNLLNKNLKSTDDVYTIPIVFHIIHLGEPVGSGINVSDELILNSLNHLNNEFSENLNIDIQFCLANKDPEGNATNGINRVDGSGVTNYSDFGISFNGCFGADDPTIRDLSKWPVTDYYNVWVVRSICTGSAGFASFPNGGDYDGTVIEHTYLTYDAETLTHETGHWFNLHHTFFGASGSDCPPNDDCLNQGDLVCDTPPHRQSHCSPSSPSPCFTSGDWENSRSNFMSYCGARSRFTPGQKDRMRATFLTYPRQNLLNSLGCSATLNVEGEDKKNEVSIYPNPTNGILFLKILSSEEALKVDIYNILGQNFKFDIVNNSINVSNLTEGVYFLKIEFHNKTILKRIIKKDP